MSESAIACKLTRLLVEQLDVEPEQITPAAVLVEELGADHLDVQEIIMTIEEEWNLEIDQATAETLITVGDLLHLIEDLAE